jgi:putative ABC transport system substrate-binding protein
MLYVLKRLSLGLVLIALTSGILLISDSTKRRGQGGASASGGAVKRIAILQHTSSPVMEQTIAGMIDGLAEQGFREGDNITIRKYNAEGDMATGNAIAHEMTNGQYDLLLTSSTPAMQAVARANRDGSTVQVFGAVADPFVSGVGLDRSQPLKHPRNLVGVGTMLPVEPSFQLARRCLPGLRVIGTAFNPAETNSQIFMKEARSITTRMGLQLVEANVENTVAVREAIKSLINRGVQLIWVPGDNMMASSMDQVVAVCREAGIPAISIVPGKPDRGTLIDCGLDFHEAGRLTGSTAARILKGDDPTKIPIRDAADMVRHPITVNTLALKGLKEAWQVPDDVARQADFLVDETGTHTRKAH